MLATVIDLLNIIYILLIIFLIILLILQVLYPGYSIFDFFKSDSKHDPNDDFNDDDHADKQVPGIPGESADNVEIPVMNSDDYQKYNQNFKIEKVTSEYRQKYTESQISYQDLITLIEEKDFIADYTESTREILREKIKMYTSLKNKVATDLRLSNGSATPGITGTHDSNLELLSMMSKEFDDILAVLQENLRILSKEKIRQDLRDLMNNKKYGMVSIIGREDVKNYLARQIFTFSKNPKVFLNSFQNVRLYGPSGIGKSKLAESMGYIYAKSHILGRRKYRDYTSKNFTSQYVNESRRLTYKLLLAGLEGISFIDEAYGLSEVGVFRDHGTEAITELVNFLDKHMGLSIVIIAGYEIPMEKLIHSNEGLERRFPHLFKLEKYSSKQLTEILIKFLKQTSKSLTIDKKDVNCVYTYIDFIDTQMPEVFEKQAGAMKLLSASILEAIYNSKDHEWLPGNVYLKVRAYLLFLGFNGYLNKYGFAITLPSVASVHSDYSSNQK